MRWHRFARHDKKMETAAKPGTGFIYWMAAIFLCSMGLLQGENPKLGLSPFFGESGELELSPFF